MASIRYFYPNVPVRLLVGGPLQWGLTDELRRYWGVELARIAPGNYGWGFVKLEPLFGIPGERFLVLDADTVLTGPVLDAWADSDSAFLVDDEAQSESEIKRLYYDWEKVRTMGPRAKPPRFVFNTGQWFGTAGVLTREDFAPWVEWTNPRRLLEPTIFKQGEQGLLNYVLNQKVIEGLGVERRKIMRWSGHGTHGLEADKVARWAAQPLVVHWAGMKRGRIRTLLGNDLLMFFEHAYYRRLRLGWLRRLATTLHECISRWFRLIRIHLHRPV